MDAIPGLEGSPVLLPSVQSATNGPRASEAEVYRGKGLHSGEKGE